MSISMLLRTIGAQDVAATNDGQLLEQYVARRDQAAFAVLLRRHGPTVLGVCRRLLNNETDAEDAFQATFLVLIYKARSLTGRAILGDWLHQVARHTALKARVAAARRRVKEQAVARPETAPTAHEPNDWLPRLDDAVRRLPQKYRLPVLLCDLEGKTRRQAADQLGWPEGTVAGRLARARTLLARQLQRSMPLGVGGLTGLLAAGSLQAAIRPSLNGSLNQAAAHVAAGGTASGVVSTTALALSHGVMQTMFWNKIKIGALVLLAFVVFAGGAGLAYRALAGEPPAQPLQVAALPAPLPAQAQVQVQTPVKASFGEDLFTLQGHTNSAICVAFSPDGKRLASASADETVKIWDTATGKEILTFRAHKRQVRCVAFHPTLNQVASSGEDGNVIIWDGATGKEILTFIGHNHLGSSVQSLAFSPDGKRMASGNGSPGGLISAKVWDATTGNENFTIKFGGMVASLAFSPDGKLLASATGDRKLGVWNSLTGKEIAEIPLGKDNFAACVAFSPDSKRIVSANDDRTVVVWDAATGKALLSLKGHGREATSVAFSPDGRIIASSAYDATVRLWDAATGKELDQRGGFNREAHTVAFSADGTRLAAGSSDGVVRMWQIKTEKQQ